MAEEGHRRANSSSSTGAALPPRTSSTARPRGKEAPGVGAGGTGVGATPAGNSSRCVVDSCAVLFVPLGLCSLERARYSCSIVVGLTSLLL